MTVEDLKDAVVIPRWCLWLLGICAGLMTSAGIPWAVSVYSALSTVRTDIEVLKVRMEGRKQLDTRLERAEQVLAEHVADPRIHHSGIEAVNRRIDAVERRVDRLEQQEQ